jgi:DNA repair protein RadC
MKMPEKMNEIKVVNVRLVQEQSLYTSNPIHTPMEAAKAIMGELCKYDREVLMVANMTTKGRIINMNMVSMGTINASLVEPREFFKSAVLSNASNVMAFHNHPSGDPTPSKEDIAITKRLKEIGDLTGIHLMDHIIVGANDPNNYVSMMEQGYMTESRQHQSKEKSL